MGNFCWMCERIRPNEAFSGKNHHRHLCRECARLPKSERERKRWLDALWEMLHRQSNISRKNLQMAAMWASEGDAEVAALANLVIDIGIAHPHRRKRLPFIRRNRPELWKRMVAAGMAEEWPDQDPLDEYPTDDAPVVLDHRPEEPLEESAIGVTDYDDDEIPF
ncbi:MAG TPA: hypothetical protein VEZ11_11555 [Thermoanaerobaculia bacterium]|nr:hypothetical protein [Thermoanaerobaculia bacterium]